MRKLQQHKPHQSVIHLTYIRMRKRKPSRVLRDVDCFNLPHYLSFCSSWFSDGPSQHWKRRQRRIVIPMVQAPPIRLFGSWELSNKTTSTSTTTITTHAAVKELIDPCLLFRSRTSYSAAFIMVSFSFKVGSCAVKTNSSPEFTIRHQYEIFLFFPL